MKQYTRAVSLAKPVTSLLAAALLLTACGKDKAPAAAPANPPAKAAAPSKAPAPKPPAPEAATPDKKTDKKADEKTAGAEPDAKPAAPKAKPEAAKPSKVDPRKNAWGVKSRGAKVKEGDRVYVLTRGRDRSHTDERAVYHLYAYDVKGVDKDLVSLRELGGGDFTASGLFVIPAGVADAKSLKKGDPVLAEWASSLKHAVVVGFAGDKVKVRYTDLPDSWKEDKLTALKPPRELTLQKEGFSPGNFAVASLDGQRYLVMLVAELGERWLVRRFAGRVTTMAKDKLAPIPLTPKLKRRQKVSVPWVGMMYPGRIAKVKGPRAWVKVEGIGQDKPVQIPLGQIVPSKGR